MLLGDLAHWERFHDGPWCRLDERAREVICEVTIVQVLHVVHVIALDVIQDLQKVHVGRRSVASMVVSISLFVIVAIRLHHVLLRGAAFVEPVVARRSRVLTMSSTPPAARILSH